MTVSYTSDEEEKIDRHLREHGMTFSQYARACLAERNGTLAPLYVSPNGERHRGYRSFWMSDEEKDQLRRDAQAALMRVSLYVKARTLYGFKRVITRESARRMARLEAQRLRLGLNFDALAGLLNRVRVVRGAACVWDGSEIRWVLEWPEDCLTESQVEARMAMLEDRKKRKWTGGGDGKS
jgi:hypothetical protein